MLRNGLPCGAGSASGMKPQLRAELVERGDPFDGRGFLGQRIERRGERLQGRKGEFRLVVAVLGLLGEFCRLSYR